MPLGIELDRDDFDHPELPGIYCHTCQRTIYCQTVDFPAHASECQRVNEPAYKQSVDQMVEEAFQFNPEVKGDNIIH